MKSTALHAAMSTLGVLIGLAIFTAALVFLAWLLARRRMQRELSIMEARRQRFDERWTKLEADIDAGTRVPRGRRFKLKPKDRRP